MEEKPFVYKKKTTKKRVVKKEAVKEAPRKIIGVIYYATYMSKHKHITYTGIGKTIPGKEYLVEKKIAEALATSKNWKIRKSYSYADIK